MAPSVWNVTVIGPGVSTASTMEKKKARGKGPVSCCGWFGSSIRSKVNFTASASNGVPS